MTDRHKPVGRRGLRRPAPEYSRGGRAGASQRRHLRALWSGARAGCALLLAMRGPARGRVGPPRGAEARLDPVRRPRGVHRVVGQRGPGGRPRRPERVPRGRPGADRVVRRERREVHRGRGDGGLRCSGRARRRRRAGRAGRASRARCGGGPRLGARGPGGGEHGRGDRPRRGGGGRSHRDRGRREHGGPAAGRRPRRPARGRGRDPARDQERDRLRAASGIGREGEGEPRRDVARSACDRGARGTAGDARPVRRPGPRAGPDPLGVAPGHARLEAAPGHRRRADRHREVTALARDRRGGRRRWRSPASVVAACRTRSGRATTPRPRSSDRRSGSSTPTRRRSYARSSTRASPVSCLPRRARTRHATSGCCSGSVPASRG